MSADWQVGDLAVAIRGVRFRKGSAGDSVAGTPRVRIGGIYTVERVIIWDGVVGLNFVGHTSCHETGAWHSGYFLKVTPPVADEFDRETIALMSRVGEPA